MQRENWTWKSSRLTEPARVVRWGHFGTPVLLFPTAGGDFEEVERFNLVRVLGELIEAGRIKVFSVDGVAARAWLRGTYPPEHCARVQSLYDAFIYEEVVPFIRRDCQSERIEIIVAGASIGAYNAVASLCRHPDVFRVAVALSGIYDLSKYLQSGFTQELYLASPLHYLPGLDEGRQLHDLRRRFVQLGTGEGDYETPAESRRLAGTLGARGIPNHLDLWGRDHAHTWRTWREMLPRYLSTYA
jgi:esterase/lipase superfamily enzyme